MRTKFVVFLKISFSKFTFDTNCKLEVIWVITFNSNLLVAGMETSSEYKCPFCHEGTMREDSCGCLTCKKCHRVEGTNCNITGCQNARFSTCA